MSFFHKTVNERLVQHISDLDQFGLLPIDWFWHKDRVQSLGEISQALLDDLIHLHNAHQDLGQTIPHIIPLIKELHSDLEKMEKDEGSDQNRWSAEATIVNGLIENLRNSLERQGYVRYGASRGPIMYLTPKEIAYYNSLVDENKWKNALRYIKRKWNERVDRSFIQSVHLIHWGHLDKIEFALTSHSRKAELCCNGYLQPPYVCNWIGGVGLLIEGHITLAGNTDIQTNQWSFGKKEYSRYTEYAEHLCLNAQTFIPPEQSGRHNEFIVGNWKPKAIVFDNTKFCLDDYDKYLGVDKSVLAIISFLKEFSKKHNLTLLDVSGKRV